MAQQLKTDRVLFYTILFMVFFGLVILYSASSFIAEIRYQWSGHFVLRQLGWAIVSILALLVLKTRNYRLLNKPVWAFAGVGIVVVMLIAVYFIDAKSHRWVRLGMVSIQPSEFAKPALILFLAVFLTWRARAINNLHTLVPAGILIALLAGTIVVADLGTAMVLVATAATVFWVAGLEKKYCFIGLGVLSLCVVGAICAKPYRLNRMIHYLDPEYKILSIVDPNGHIKKYANSSLATRDPNYQARQSKIAIGSGGITGLGLMEGKQKLMYLPEAHTDFIYAVVGEELGLTGCLLVLTGFMIILYRGLRLYWLAPDDFGRYLALGVVASVVFQAMINMSVVLDMGPTKGIPLPMISHGGSSLFSTLTSLGMLLSVSDHAA